MFGWRAPALLHDDSPPLDLLASVLSAGRASRLYRAVRERRLASSIVAYDYTPTEIGVFVVHATARPEHVRSAARGTWDQLRRVRDGEITGPEIERARRVLEAQWLRRFESMEGQANHLASWELAGSWTLGGAYLDRLLTTDGARLTEVARLAGARPRRARGVSPIRRASRCAGRCGDARLARRRTHGAAHAARPPRSADANSWIESMGVRA